MLKIRTLLTKPYQLLTCDLFSVKKKTCDISVSIKKLIHIFFLTNRRYISTKKDYTQLLIRFA